MCTRVEIENRLLSAFPGTLAPLDPIRHRDIVNQYKDGRFAWSMNGLALYGTGYALRAVSPNRFGLLYVDGLGNHFGVGVFRRQLQEDQQFYLHVIAPGGPTRVEAVAGFIDLLRSKRIVKGPIYVRHVPEEDVCEYLSNAGFSEVTTQNHPWHPMAPIEDETYSHGTIDLDSIISLDSSGSINRVFNAGGGRSCRTQARQSFNRMQRFFSLNQGARIELVETSLSTEGGYETALDLVRRHFEMLVERGTAIGSTVQDYLGILELQRQARAEYWSCFAYLFGSGARIPISYFAGEYVDEGKETLALYCNITSRDPRKLNGFDSPHLAQGGMTRYAMLRVFARLARQGVRVVKLGGSETPGLNYGKIALGAVEERTTWLVA